MSKRTLDCITTDSNDCKAASYSFEESQQQPNKILKLNHLHSDSVIKSLPEETLCEIFSYLEGKEIFTNCQLVCHEWADICFKTPIRSLFVNIENDLAFEKLKCVNTTRLIELMGILGSERMEFAKKLENLTILDLRCNQLGNEHAEMISHMSTLKHLRLSFNYIEEIGCEHLCKLSKLKELDLFGNRIGIEGAQLLSNLTNLEELNIGEGYIEDEGLEHLSKLRNLTVLNIASDCLSSEGIVHLENLKQLKTLTLTDNAVGAEGMAVIGKMVTLTNLNLNATQIEDEGLKHLSNLTKLTELDVSNNFSISEKGFRFLKTLPLKTFICEGIEESLNE